MVTDSSNYIPTYYVPPHYRNNVNIKTMNFDVKKVNVQTNKCLLINKNNLSISQVGFHHPECKCRLPEIVSINYFSKEFYLFQSKINRKVWYIIRKSIMHEIIERCFDIFPCKFYKGRLQMNGFPFVVTKNLDDLSKLKELCDEVRNNISLLSSTQDFKRDYHTTTIIKCENYICHKDTPTKIKYEIDSDKIYYGFTCPYMPKSNNLFVG